MQYEIQGEPFGVVICTLDAGEQMRTESGSMVWMTPNMDMSTNAGGGVGKAFGRVFSGESMFQNIFTSQGGPGLIAFAASFPGKIWALDIDDTHPMVVQKTGFLASEMSVGVSVFFNPKVSGGFFGGEGFIMQKLSGHGKAFVEIDGSIVQYELQEGQQMVVDTGNLAMCDASVQISAQTVKGLKNKMFGGEGFFNTIVTGPGRIWLQTMPMSALAASIAPFVQTGSS
jgi:uncharacterized protein (TIGR00266 family)